MLFINTPRHIVNLRPNKLLMLFKICKVIKYDIMLIMKKNDADSTDCPYFCWRWVENMGRKNVVVNMSKTIAKYVGRIFFI